MPVARTHPVSRPPVPNTSLDPAADPFLRAAASPDGAAEHQGVLGLVALRVLERWGESRQPVSPHLPALVRLRALLADASPEDTCAKALARLADRVADDRGCPAVIGAALDYARELRYATRFDLAVAVYDTALRYVDATVPEELELLFDGSIDLARAHRWLGNTADVTRVLGVTYRLALEHRRVDVRLRVRVSRASSMIMGGDLGRGYRACRRVVRDAARLGLRQVEGYATGELGLIVSHMGRQRRAVVLLGRALELTDDPSLRENFLNSLGTAFEGLGHRRAARDTWSVLEATSAQGLVRKVAGMNLMRLAADFGDRLEFERRRGDLLEAPPPPVVLSAAHLFIGEGYELFGEPELARAAYRRAIAHATEHHVHYWTYRAEQQLAAVRDDEPAPPSGDVAPTTPDVIQVAHRMERLRFALTEA